MTIKQISVFIENKSGRLYEVTKVMKTHQVNIRALSLADTADFGVLRIIVDNPEETLQILRDNHFTVRLTNVIGIEVPDQPGGLSSVLQIMDDLGINVEYMYAFVEKANENAVLIFRFDNLENIIDTLKQNGLKLLDQSDVSRI